MAKTVFVGCRLPHGIVLEHPGNPAHQVTIAGLNKVLIIGQDYATTEVDADFWAAWVTFNKEFPALLSGAIFEAKSSADVAAVAKEHRGRKTGFEPLPQNADGVTAAKA